MLPTKDQYSFADLVKIMRRLLSEDGCPWDRQQTLTSLKQYLVEETQEVLEAIDEGDPEHLQEELGDLLFQVVFQAAICERDGSFSIEDVITSISQKLVRRHPHVFGDEPAGSPEDLRHRWEEIKRQEAAARQPRRGDHR